MLDLPPDCIKRQVAGDVRALVTLCLVLGAGQMLVYRRQRMESESNRVTKVAFVALRVLVPGLLSSEIGWPHNTRIAGGG